MKKIFINASTIKEGGGAVIFIKTLNEMMKLQNDIHWIVVLDAALKDKININSQLTILSFPWIKKSPFHFLYWNEIYLPNLIRKLKIDCFYSEINTLPIRKLSCPAFLSTLHAGYFSAEFIKKHFHYNRTVKDKIAWKLRQHWIFTSTKRADHIVAPTQALADEIISQLKVQKNKIDVVLPGAGLAEGSVFSKQAVPDKKWRIGYITKFGVQKNFDVLFSAAAKLKQANRDFSLVISLEKSHPTYQHIAPLIEKYDIADVLENHGEISKDEIQALYPTLDLFIFPSLCESIGFPLIEAMYYGLPIIAADMPSNRELLGESGLFFSPHDANALFEKMMLILDNKLNYLALSHDSIERCKLFSWEKSAKETLTVLTKAF